MAKKKFLRRNCIEVSKLGKRRKKKQKWRRPTGRDNKMREKRRGYPVVVGIGNRKEKSSRGKIKDKKPVVVRNMRELERLNKNEIIIIGKIGKKKREELLKKAGEKNIPVLNLPKKIKSAEDKK